MESWKERHDASSQLRSFGVKNAHHKDSLTKVMDDVLTDFSATFLGELATSIPISSFAVPLASRINLVVASVFRSCMTNVSLDGIFARRFCAIGYPNEGTSQYVSRFHC